MVCNSALNDTRNQFTTPSKKNQKNGNNLESLTLQVDGPITESAYKRGGGGGGGAYNRDFTVTV